MLDKADALTKTYEAPPHNFIGFEGWVSSDMFAEWRTQSLVVLTQILGSDHQYTRSFDEGTEKPAKAAGPSCSTAHVDASVSSVATKEATDQERAARRSRPVMTLELERVLARVTERVTPARA